MNMPDTLLMLPLRADERGQYSRSTIIVISRSDNSIVKVATMKPGHERQWLLDNAATYTRDRFKLILGAIAPIAEILEITEAEKPHWPSDEILANVRPQGNA
jgi:hypothetical protein